MMNYSDKRHTSLATPRPRETATAAKALLPAGSSAPPPPTATVRALRPRRPHGEETSRLRHHQPRRRRRRQRQRPWHGAVAHHLTAEPFVETVRRLAQQLRVVVELPEPGVAFSAKQ